MDELAIAEKVFMFLFNAIKSSPDTTVATLSIILNIYLFNKVLFYNNKYIGLLINNSNIQGQMNKLLDSFHVKKELVLVEKEDESLKQGEKDDGNGHENH